MMLLGLDINEAKKMLEENGIEFEIKEYQSKKPYENANSFRVVRELQPRKGFFSLTVCGFVTEINE